MTDVVQTVYYVFIDCETEIIYVSEIMFNAGDPHFTSYADAIEYAERQAEFLGFTLIPF